MVKNDMCNSLLLLSSFHWSVSYQGPQLLLFSLVSWGWKSQLSSRHQFVQRKNFSNYFGIVSYGGLAFQELNEVRSYLKRLQLFLICLKFDSTAWLRIQCYRTQFILFVIKSIFVCMKIAYWFKMYKIYKKNTQKTLERFVLIVRTAKAGFFVSTAPPGALGGVTV